MSKYFYHGISGLSAPDIMIAILKSSGIKSRRKQNISYMSGYNGLDYISLCRKEEKQEYETHRMNAFKSYILNNFCFIIRDDISAIKCEYRTDILEWDYIKLLEFMDAYPERRITDMFDEWQVKDEIPLSNIIGIGLPLKLIRDLQLDGYKEIKTLICEIVFIAEALGLDIVDSSRCDFVEQYEYSKEKEKNMELKLNI